MCAQSLRPVPLFVTPCTVAGQTPWSMAFSRQEDRSGLQFPTPRDIPNPGLESTSTHNINNYYYYGDVVVQWLSHVQLFVTPQTAAHQASLSLTISQSLPKFMSIESVMPSKHLILCQPLLLCFQSFPASGLFHGNDSLSELLCANHYSKHLPYFFVAVAHSLSHVRLFALPWAAAGQASLSSIISQSLLKFTCIESGMLSSHHPLPPPSPFALNISTL